LPHQDVVASGKLGARHGVQGSYLSVDNLCDPIQAILDDCIAASTMPGHGHDVLHLISECYILASLGFLLVVRAPVLRLDVSQDLFHLFQLQHGVYACSHKKPPCCPYCAQC